MAAKTLELARVNEQSYPSGRMTLVSNPGRTKLAIWKPALWLVFVAQLVLTLTPLIEARDGPDARAHVEEVGTRIHHVHDESYCSACTVRHLLGSTEVLQHETPDERVVAVAAVASKARTYRSETAPHTRSRAPPALT